MVFWFFFVSLYQHPNKVKQKLKNSNTMLRHEFEELMGDACTEEVFNGKINPLYMMTDMDKRDFCDDYKLHGHSRIMDEVCEHALKVEHQLNAANKLIAELKFEQLEMYTMNLLMGIQQ